MPIIHVATTWIAMLALTVPLALLLLAAFPSGAIITIVAHAVLLVVGAAVVLALESREEE